MYHDLIIQIKNAEAARKTSLRKPYSRLEFDVAKVLAGARYLKGVKKKIAGKKIILDIELPTDFSEYKKVEDVRFVSTPGKRVYRGYRALRPVAQGFGLGVVSTSGGVMDAHTARKMKLGGEYLFELR